MGLCDQAALDFVSIASDVERGFGHMVRLRNSACRELELSVLSTDIAQTIDINTGQLIVGRTAVIDVPLAPLRAVGFGDPKAENRQGEEPWIVEWVTHGGVRCKFMIVEVRPDYKLDVTTCFLSAIR